MGVANPTATALAQLEKGQHGDGVSAPSRGQGVAKLDLAAQQKQTRGGVLCKSQASGFEQA